MTTRPTRLDSLFDDSLRRRLVAVLIVVQPAEEVTRGALAVLASGALDEVSKIFGGHRSFSIELEGGGGHGARPHETARIASEDAAL